MGKPRVMTRCPAAAHAGSTERIIEFASGKTQRSLRGGLISFLDVEGRMIVDVYGLHGAVEVRAHDPRRAAASALLEAAKRLLQQCEIIATDSPAAMAHPDLVFAREAIAKAEASGVKEDGGC